MWPRRFFAGRYFAPTYWSESDGDAPPVVASGGSYLLMARRRHRR